jgi:glycosyltransferase involved in cell wall biosynthesis
MTIALSAVIPVFNEVDNLGPLHTELTEALAAFGRPYEIVYVDDGSTDGSFPILRTLQEQDPHVVVVRFARNFGQTAALAAGFDHASGAVVVTLDADRQNVPADIPALVGKLDEGYDLAVGWRHARRDPWLSRKLPSVVANALIGWITGVRLHDYGCTLKAMRRDLVRGLRLYGEMHRFIPALASDLGARIVEVPVDHRPRVAGRSKYGLSRIIRVVLDLITVKFLSSYSTRPIQVFGVIGLVSSFVGLVLTGVLGIERLFFGMPLANRPVLWLGILLTLMGMQFVTMGLLGELLVRTYHEAQNKPVYLISEVRRAGRLDAAGDPR